MNNKKFILVPAIEISIGHLLRRNSFICIASGIIKNHVPKRVSSLININSKYNL